MSFCGHSDFVRAKPEKKSIAPVWGSSASKNFFERQTSKLSEKYDEFNWMAEGPKIRKNLFAPEIARINAKDPVAAATILAVCDAAINFLKHEEIAVMFFKEGMKLSVVAALGSGSHSVMVNTHVELRDENNSKAWACKRQLEGYGEQIMQLLRKPEYKGNELLGYLLMVIDRQPQFIGKQPVGQA
jgi:hypothetical protein